jgi:DNA-binding transcriptional ArsR family regulator
MKTREAIIYLLSTQDLTASEIANRLSLPKQVVYYHLHVLSKDGIITVKDFARTNGRFRARVYGLPHCKPVIIVPSLNMVRESLQWLEDYYIKHLKLTPEQRVDEHVFRLEFTLFMYHVMRTCLDLMGTDQNRIFSTYGAKLASDVIAPLTGEGNLNSGMTAFRKALLLLDKIIAGGLSILEENGKTFYIIHFKKFLASGRFDARIDEFLRSCLERLSQIFLKGKTIVEKYPNNSVKSYSYLIKRVDVKDF